MKCVIETPHPYIYGYPHYLEEIFDRTFHHIVQVFSLKGKLRFAKKKKFLLPTIVDKNSVTNDKVYRKVAILMYTEMFNFRPRS